jgi:hydrogenase expression/formation protein HypC
MCLAIPAKIKEKTAANLAVVDVMGVTRKISLDLVPDAKIDDWVLMHAGFAINIVDEQFAQETIELIHSIQFSDDGGTLTGEAPVPFEGTMSGGMEATRAAAIASGAMRAPTAAEATKETEGVNVANPPEADSPVEGEELSEKAG